MKRTPFKKPDKPYVWKKPTKPMNKVGRKGKQNAKSDKTTKAELVKKGIDCCQLCGRNSWLSRSHSYKKRFNTDNDRIALLCVTPCHNFIELRLDAETRVLVNDFLIDTNLEGEDRFNAVVEMIPESLQEEFIRKITQQ